jgi:SAM-dependent methyltransferase
MEAAKGALILHNAMFVGPDGQKRGPWTCPLSEGDVPPERFIERLLIQNFIAINSPVFRRKEALETGGLDEALWFSADWDLWLRLGALGPVRFIAETLTAFRVHSASLTAARKLLPNEWEQQLAVVLDRHLSNWSHAGKHRASVKRVAMASIAVNSALSAAFRGESTKPLTVLLELLSLGPAGWRRYLRDSRIVQRVGSRVKLRPIAIEQELRVPATESRRDYAPCPVCDGNEWITVREGEDLCRPKYKKSFKLTRCSSCGHVTQNPKPDELELNAAYSVSRDYAPYRPAWKESGWPVWKILRSWTTRRRVSWLNRFASGKNLLEVGCGGGDFLAAAHRAGWKVSSVEYNSSLVDMICRELGFDVRSGELALGLWNEGQFDVVAFWNTLEHLQDPLRELSIAAHYLRPGGRVFLQIPSRQAAESGRWLGQYWAPLDLPRHLNFYDEATLSRLCGKAGLDLVVYKTPFVQSAWCYYMSSWRWANQDGKRKLRWLWFIALGVAVTLCVPCVAIQAMRKRGMEAFAVADRR